MGTGRKERGIKHPRHKFLITALICKVKCELAIRSVVAS